MRINNNVTAMNTHRMYTNNNSNVSKSVSKLSSGYRINSAADDAAGLAISEKMRAQIRGLNMASKNSQDAQSMVQTAEGALQETHNILQRMRELATQSASDTNEKTVDRAALQQEFSQLQEEINDIANKTVFNDQKLLDGTFSKTITQIANGASGVVLGSGYSVRASATGSNYGQFTISAATPNAAVTASTTGGTSATATITDFTAGTNSTALAGVTTLQTSAFNGNTYSLVVDDQGDNKVTFRIMSGNNVVSESGVIDLEKWTAAGTEKVSFDGFGTLSFTAGAAGTTAEQMKADLLGNTINGKTFSLASGTDAVVTAAKPASVDLTMNGETVNVKLGDTSVTFKDSGVTLYFDGGVRDSDLATGGKLSTLATLVIGVSALSGNAMTIQTGANQGDELSINIDKMNTVSLGISGSTIDTRTMASQAITEVNTAINKVSTQRAALGALSNRLDHKIANLDTSSENLQAAESRIRDVDMAKEMTNFTKNNILAQASTAMLAQANALPQGVLQLLG